MFHISPSGMLVAANEYALRVHGLRNGARGSGLLMDVWSSVSIPFANRLWDALELD
jgi:hypothetical protein